MASYTDYQIEVLGALGLTAWQSRTAQAKALKEVADVLAEEPHHSVDTAAPAAASEPQNPPRIGPDVVTIGVVYHDDFAFSPDHPAGKLLGDVLNACRIPAARLNIVHAGNGQLLEEKLTQLNLRGPLLVFADTSAVASATLVLPSLGRMMRDQAAKRAAWEQLKPMVGRL